MANKYVCPACQQELKGRVCSDSDCGCDLDVLFKDLRFEPDALHDILLASGFFYNTGTKSYMMHTAEGVPPIEISAHKPSQDLERLLWWFITEQSYPKSKFTKGYLQAYMSVASARRVNVPRIDHFGDRPQLFLINDELTWPNPDSMLSRLIPEASFYYSGPVLNPKRNGEFEKFLASFKCPDDESRHVLRGWIVGAFLQSLCPPGGVPMLLFTADGNGTGKTGCARVLSYLLGGGLIQHWPDIKCAEEMARKIMDPSCRVIVFDNLSPARNETMIHAPGMAALITNAVVAVKTMFVSRGMTTVPNYYLYMGTGNKPILACELFSRCVLSALSNDIKSTDNWERDWMNKRVPLLEDIMAYILENWAKGPVDCLNMPPGYRFRDWYKAVAQAMQQEPTLHPTHMETTPPLDYLLDETMGQMDEECPSLDDVLLTASKGSRGSREVLTQRTWTLESVRKELASYKSKFRVIDIGGIWCVQRRTCGTALTVSNK
jgi:hypothetical protein